VTEPSFRFTRLPYSDISSRIEWPRTSPEGTEYWPSENRFEKGTPADFQNAKEQFRMRTVEEWIALFDRAPHVMHQILGDIFRETRAEEERLHGKARIGRRPKIIEGSLEELWEMITPQYATEPFPIAVKDLIAKSPSLRAFALKAKMNHPTLLRLMSGEMKLDRHRLTQIARAGGVHPAYFMEYREMVVIEAIGAVFSRKPTYSIAAYKELQKARHE